MGEALACLELCLELSRARARPVPTRVDALPRPLRALRTVYDMWRLAPLVAAAGALSVGDVAPAFSGTSFDGRTIDLSYAKQTEKGLIIWFYPRAGTGG